MSQMMSSSFRGPPSSRKRNMLLLAVCILSSVAYSEGGLFQRNLIQIPNHLGLHGEQFLPKNTQGVTYAVKDVPERDVSYSISYEDYQLLKRHKSEGQDSPYNPDPTEPGPPIVNHHLQHNQNQAKHGVSPSDVQLQHSVGANSINVYNNPLIRVPMERVVRKHMYFHAPPPGFEDMPETPIQPQKKHTNVVIIKTPFYNGNFVHLQHLFRKKQALFEDKTLIYLQSKKDEPPQNVIVPPRPSSVPEVFFVKYKTGL